MLFCRCPGCCQREFFMWWLLCHISVGVPAVEIRSPFMYTFCWHSTTLEESRQCDNGADVILCLTLCHLFGSGFWGKLHGNRHRSLCCPLWLVLCKAGGWFLAWGGCPWCSASRDWAPHSSPLAGQSCLQGSPRVSSPLSLRALGAAGSGVPGTLPWEQCSSGAGSSPLCHTRGGLRGLGKEGIGQTRKMVSRAGFFESQLCKYLHKYGLFWVLAA